MSNKNEVSEIAADARELMKIVFPNFWQYQWKLELAEDISEDDLYYAIDLAEDIIRQVESLRDIKEEQQREKLTKQDVILQRAYEQVKERGLV